MLIDLTGKRFGRWLVIERAENADYGGTQWKCLCDCGKEKIVYGGSLRRGISRSCGCLQKEEFAISCKKQFTGKEPWNKGKVIFALRKGKEGFLNVYYKKYMWAAKDRNIEFLLSKNDFVFLVESPCYYCGEIDIRFGRQIKEKFSINVNGIDRVNNKMGYTAENCVSCCESCNRAKRMMSLKEFMFWIEKVYKHTKTIRKQLDTL